MRLRIWRNIRKAIAKGARKWDNGLRGAAKNGDMEMVDFFIQKGAANWEIGLKGAAKGGHMSLVKFFLEKGARGVATPIQFAVTNKNLDMLLLLLEYYTYKGEADLREAFYGAGKSNDLIIVQALTNYIDDYFTEIAEKEPALEGGTKRSTRTFSFRRFKWRGRKRRHGDTQFLSRERSA